jgi:mersacidin/lichenicidin family type 2 lantibiotic
MQRVDVVRAWNDPLYRATLSPEELALIPANPAGLVDLSDDELKAASGMSSAVLPPATTFPGCTESTLRRFRCCP